jgi:nuclear pore complex protein Nup133
MLPARTDRPPLACLISSHSSSALGGQAKDLGVALVYPRTGEITFWESIDSAESLKLFDYKQRQGGAVTGHIRLSAGEIVEALIETDNSMAGMVLLYTSSGRIALLSLRGAYGNARLDVQVLQHPHVKSSFGFFGDLVSAIGGSRDRLVGLKTRTVGKGKVEIVSLGQDGLFRVWEASESGQPSFSGAYDTGVYVRSRMASSVLFEEGTKPTVKFLDLAVFHKSKDTDLSSGGAMRVLVLIQADSSTYASQMFNGQSGHSRLFILEMWLKPDQSPIGRIIPVGTYEPSKGANPKLVLSENEKIMFVLDGTFITAVWHSQTHSDSDGESVESLHQDMIRLKEDHGYEITAWAADPHNQYRQSKDTGSITVFVKPGTLLRVTAKAMSSDRIGRQFPTAKTKIEQAVFFGNQADNILDLKNVSNFAYSASEIEEAALEISQDIVNTKTSYLPQQAASMDKHLEQRIKAHQDLAAYLRSSGFQLSRDTKWKLLQDGEKLAAARGMWKIYEVRLQHAEADTSGNLLEEAARLALKQRKRDDDHPMDGSAKDDPTRLWFTEHVANIEKIWRGICADIKKTTADQGNSNASVERIVDLFYIVFTSLEAGFKFRRTNAEAYGLGSEDISARGLLKSDYEGLPPLWTSNQDVVRSVWLSIDLARPLIRRASLKDQSMKNVSKHLQERLEQQATGMEVAVVYACNVYIEQYRWLMASSDPDEQNKGLEAKNAFESNIRRKWILALYSIGQAEIGLKIAEEQDDVASLVEVTHLEMDQLALKMRKDRNDIDKMERWKAQWETLEQLEGHYSVKFKERFLHAFYEGFLVSGRQAGLLNTRVGTREQFTTFLRSDPALGKLAWINETIMEPQTDGLLMAGKELLNVAQNRETNGWSKRIELDLARLSLLAVDERKRKDPPLPEEADSEVKQLMEGTLRARVVTLAQKQTFDHIKRVVTESHDSESVLENVMNTFGTHVQKERTALGQLLRLGFSDLIAHRGMSAAFLIDILTLMDPVEVFSHSKDDNLNGKQFLLALQVLKAAQFTPEAEQMLRRLIWKRCYLRDNWIELTNAPNKRDFELETDRRQTFAFETMLLGIKADFFTTPIDATIPMPTEVLGAGSHASDFEGRFGGEELRKPIAKDNAHDDAALKATLKKVPKLDDLLRSVYELAIKEAQDEAAAEIEKQARYVKFLKKNDEVRKLPYAVHAGRVYDKPLSMGSNEQPSGDEESSESDGVYESQESSEESEEEEEESEEVDEDAMDES